MSLHFVFKAFDGNCIFICLFLLGCTIPLCGKLSVKLNFSYVYLLVTNFMMTSFILFALDYFSVTDL